MDRPRRQGNRPGPCRRATTATRQYRRTEARLAFARKESATAQLRYLHSGTGQKAWKHNSPIGSRKTIRALRGLPTAGFDYVFIVTNRMHQGSIGKNANGVGAEELIYPMKSNFVPYQWPTPDKDPLFHGRQTSISRCFLSQDRKSTDLGGSQGGGADGSLSPDGRWLAYYSRETGRLEVTTFPPSSTRITVAPSGGDTHWSRKGNALFYLTMRTGELMGVDVTPGDPRDSPRPGASMPAPWTSSRFTASISRPTKTVSSCTRPIPAATSPCS